MRSESRVPHLLASVLTVGCLVVAAAPAAGVRTTFGNDTGLAIMGTTFKDNTTTFAISDNTQAGLYPSSIGILTPGVIVDVDVWIESFSHQSPDDVDILLVGPGGRQATLMSDAGGSNAIDDDFLAFDDEDPDVLPDSGVVGPAVDYRPANYEGADAFPSPAPAATGESSLSVFDGTNATGTWSLFVVDDTPGNTGEFGSGGWGLDITVRSAPYPSQVEVGGLGTQVSDVNLSLSGLSHNDAGEIDILLVGPDGEQATVMSDAGFDESIANVDLVLDDEAQVGFPPFDPIETGSYQPTNLGLVLDPYLPPAPVSTGASALSVFDGTDPNGTWSLYVVDDSGGSHGSLRGWSLDIETDDTPPTGSVQVNGGEAAATSRSVTLDLTANDPGTPSSGVAEMRLSNDGSTFTAYETFASTKPWTLSHGDGAKQVYVQYRDASGIESSVVSDTIKLDTIGPRATKMSPPNHGTGIATSTKVKIVASEKLTKSSVNGTTVALKAPSGKVAAKVSYNADTRTITITPDSALRHHVTYVVTVAGVKDLNGLTWDQLPQAGVQPLRFSFTTV